MVNICFVCLGNICRSPLAEGVFQKLVQDHGLADSIPSESAGTGHWHVGNPPDRRMQATANKNGVQLNSRARQFVPEDFERFDLIFAMDQSNLDHLTELSEDPAKQKKVMLFRSFDPHHNGDLDVPDPYYGGDGGFDRVFQIVSRTCPKILDYIKTHHL